MATLLFDLDGTLADTAPDLHAAMNHVLVGRGYNAVAAHQINRLIGGGARMILQRGLAENGITLDDAALDAATEAMVLRYDRYIDVHTRLYPNVLPVLKNAKAAGIKLAVVTNKRENLSAKLLFRLGLHAFFDTLIGGDTLPQRKPEPHMIDEALRRLGESREHAIMVGDSEADTQAAKAAGVATICVSFGYRRVALAALGADAVIDDFSEFAQAAKKLKPKLFAAL